MKLTPSQIQSFKSLITEIDRTQPFTEDLRKIKEIAGIILAESNEAALKKAVEELETIADTKSFGHREANWLLGKCHQLGIGVPKDETKAVAFFQTSAHLISGQLPYARAVNSLGAFYELGTGVPKDQKKAVEYYEIAARQNHLGALYNLGNCYLEPRGVAKNEKKAFEYYKQAADLGHAAAQRSVGLCYQQGIGVPKNDEMAAKYLKLSEAQNNTNATQSAGVAHQNDGKRKEEIVEIIEIAGNVQAGSRSVMVAKHFGTTLVEYNKEKYDFVDTIHNYVDKSSMLASMGIGGASTDIPREVILVSEKDKSDILANWTKFSKDKLHNKTNPLPEQAILNLVNQFTRKALGSPSFNAEAEAKKLAAKNFAEGKKIKMKADSFERPVVFISEYLSAKRGVCRHHAIVNDIIIAHLINTDVLSKGAARQIRGKVQDDETGAQSAHAVATYLPNNNDSVWIIDSLNFDKVFQVNENVKINAENNALAEIFKTRVVGKYFYNKIVSRLRPKIKISQINAKTAELGDDAYYATELNKLLNIKDNIKWSVTSRGITTPPIVSTEAVSHEKAQEIVENAKRFTNKVPIKTFYTLDKKVKLYYDKKLIDAALAEVVANQEKSKNLLQKAAAILQAPQKSASTIDKPVASTIKTDKIELTPAQRRGFESLIRDLNKPSNDLKEIREIVEIILAEKNEPIKPAVQKLETIAQNAKKPGYLEANWLLGMCYLLGIGVKKDEKKAMILCQTAANLNQTAYKTVDSQGAVYEQGSIYPRAVNTLGALCEQGKGGLSRSEKRAAEYYKIAADAGYKSALYNLGICYFKGKGVPKDEKKAVEYFQKAADLGHALAKQQPGVVDKKTATDSQPPQKPKLK